MAIINSKVLKDAIKELKSESFETSKLVNFFEYMDKKNMFDKKYEENHKKLVDKKITRMTYKQVLTELTYLYEEEKKTGGSLYKAYKEGTLLALLERLYRLNIVIIIPLVV